MLKRLLLIITGFLLVTSSFEAHATHVRAGEITAVKASPTDCADRTFIFTLTLYVDTEGVDPGEGEINFGTGLADAVQKPNDLPADKKFFSDLGDNVGVATYIFEYTFPGPGVYTVRFTEPNRNANVLNIANSVNTPFHIETKIVIDPTVGCNNTPNLTIPPIDRGCTGVAFFHNPGAFDIDGDSLAFVLVTPKQGYNDDTNQPIFVNDYRQPNSAEFGGTQEDGTGAPTFTLDPVTGDLVWNSPGTAGEYNIAFIVEEWRKINGRYVQLGFVTRDMQIIVDECNNERPQLIVPQDTCVEAGTNLQQIVEGFDPDGDDVKIELFGLPFELTSNPASYSPVPGADDFRSSPAQTTFNWQTTCQHVRERPYQVQVKITDDPPMGPSLVTFATWNITVVAPAPENLTVNLQSDRTAELTWDPYNCGLANEIQIWRRVDSNPFEPDFCETGMPDGAGYELLDVVGVSNSSYIDDNDGQGLAFGAKYCYRLVAVFPLPGGGESYVSAETCDIIEVEGPAITNVSVEVTDPNAGEIFVRWTSPFEINAGIFPPPYTYELWRATGFTGQSALTKVYEVTSTGTPQLTDTTFTDSGMNTRDTPFNYRVILRDGGGNIIDTSAVASSVFLDAGALVKAIELTWQAEVPWSNNTPSHPLHDIYRNNVDPGNPDALVLIASVNVTQEGFYYLDDGTATGEELDENTEYCYYVLTRGSYGNPDILSPLENKSQIVCATPNDTIPPCEVQLELANPPCEEIIEGVPCGFDQYDNTIAWSRLQPEGDEVCDLEIRNYKIYYSRFQNGEFQEIATVRDTLFVHENLENLAGCYYVTAIDRSGNESAPSNIVCQENCPQYLLPNVFTPNGDDSNDVFEPFNQQDNCPRFVRNVKLRVLNRWGKQIFTYESNNGENDIFIRWNGVGDNGNLVPSGVYYYVAEVTFESLDPEGDVVEIKGWVQILY